MSSVTTSGTSRSAFNVSRIWDQFGMLVVFAVLFIGCVLFVPNFSSFINMKGLGLAISMSGMVACGMLFCLASGDFDLSVASVIACAGVTTAVVINLTESMWIGIGAGLLLGDIALPCFQTHPEARRLGNGLAATVRGLVDDLAVHACDVLRDDPLRTARAGVRTEVFVHRVVQCRIDQIEAVQMGTGRLRRAQRQA